MRNSPRCYRAHKVVLAAFILSIASATLSGCTAALEPAPSESAVAGADATAAPTKTPPVFASNDEALAAARAAYAAYTLGSNEFAASPQAGNGFDTFSGLVSKRYLPEVTASVDSFAESGHVGRGAISFDTVSLMSFSEPSPGHVEVSLYLCADVSGLRIVDKAGADVTPANRSERTPTQVALISSDTDASKLLVDKEDTWTGQNFCG
ncbi:hypothetical protein [Cryobacterium sp. Hb1]|uniref:hypothetical protein n=1 Tax=Cryobacterium sp. Hb1 TaxID=1259147 RepID=UPI00106A6C10|nr:hypothetical protein [Cryobacterium sp. Hb1]TFD66999.1 hypothetical protein E3T38_11475 [Cryobacterium sp. Hb1]